MINLTGQDIVTITGLIVSLAIVFISLKIKFKFNYKNVWKTGIYSLLLSDCLRKLCAREFPL